MELILEVHYDTGELDDNRNMEKIGFEDHNPKKFDSYFQKTCKLIKRIFLFK